MLKFIALFLVLIAFALPADAECVCKCISGTVQPICSKPDDIRLHCPSHPCPITPPASESITSPTNTDCAPVKVYNPFTAAYEMKLRCKPAEED